MPKQIGPKGEDVTKYLYLYLRPITIRMDNGDEIEIIDWYDADSNYEAAGYPHGVIERRDQIFVYPISRRLHDEVYADDEIIEVIPYDGSEVYVLDCPDIRAPGGIISVTATVGGVPDTPIPNDEWEAYGTDAELPDSVRLLGPTLPDPATSMTVTYQPIRIAVTESIDNYPVWRLTVKFQDLRAGSQGATKDYSRSELTAQTVDGFTTRLVQDRGQGLHPIPKRLSFKGPYSSTFSFKDDSSRTQGCIVDVYAHRRNKYIGQDSEAVRIVEHDVQL